MSGLTAAGKRMEEEKMTKGGGGVFAKTGDGLVPMQAQPYDAEHVLQRMLADTPELLSGDSEPTRWLLVDREIGVADGPEAGDRWSLDHLFIDADGVPTLVEVKRSSNTQIRREVVGQMLDYAANAFHTWEEGIRSRYESRCEATGRDPVAHLRECLGPDVDPDEFWDQVHANLSRGELRLVFVADEIPSELRAIVEFLNGQMTKTEVIAVEVRQFLDEDRDHQMLVSRVFGRTQAAEDAKVGPRRKSRRWTREEWFEALAEQHMPVVKEIFKWSEDRGLSLAFGTGVHDPSAKFSARNMEGTFFYVYLRGTAEINFYRLSKLPAFESEESRAELLNMLNTIPEVDIPPGKYPPSVPSVRLGALEAESSRSEFLRILDWTLERIVDPAID